MTFELPRTHISQWTAGEKIYTWPDTAWLADRRDTSCKCGWIQRCALIACMPSIPDRVHDFRLSQQKSIVLITSCMFTYGFSNIVGLIRNQIRSYCPGLFVTTVWSSIATAEHWAWRLSCHAPTSPSGLLVKNLHLTRCRMVSGTGETPAVSVVGYNGVPS